MKPAFLTLVIAMLPLQITVTRGFVDCRTACRRCREGSEELELLEVHCSMCKECRDKRRAVILSRYGAPPVEYLQDEEVQVERVPSIRRMASNRQFRPVYRRPSALRMQVENEDRLATWPEHCPTPPLCEDEEAHETNPPTAATTTTSTIPPSTCPPIDKCRTRHPNQTPSPDPHNPYTTQCVPCDSECPCPFPSEINININWNGKIPNGIEASDMPETHATETEQKKTKKTTTKESESEETETESTTTKTTTTKTTTSKTTTTKVTTTETTTTTTTPSTTTTENWDDFKINPNVLLRMMRQYDRGDTVFDPHNEMQVKGNQLIMNDQAGYFTREPRINWAQNFQSTHQDEDYLYLYLGVPKTLAQSQRATTPVNVPVVGFPPLQMF